MRAAALHYQQRGRFASDDCADWQRCGGNTSHGQLVLDGEHFNRLRVQRVPEHDERRRLFEGERRVGGRRELHRLDCTERHYLLLRDDGRGFERQREHVLNEASAIIP